jgi:membrane protein implicated in regulation of membrane protease activity
MEYVGYAWLGLVVACVIIEALTVSLATIWFAAGALVAWLVYLTGLGFEVQIVVFLLVSIVCLLFTRPLPIHAPASNKGGRCFPILSQPLIPSILQGSWP